MIRGYDSGRSHLLPFEATQHIKKDKPPMQKLFCPGIQLRRCAKGQRMARQLRPLQRSERGKSSGLMRRAVKHAMRSMRRVARGWALSLAVTRPWAANFSTWQLRLRHECKRLKQTAVVLSAPPCNHTKLLAGSNSKRHKSFGPCFGNAVLGLWPRCLLFSPRFGEIRAGQVSQAAYKRMLRAISDTQLKRLKAKALPRTLQVSFQHSAQLASRRKPLDAKSGLCKDPSHAFRHFLLGNS